MNRTRSARFIPWLSPEDPFPAIDQALGDETGLGGLVAAGADLSPARVLDAYRRGIYPWYSVDQPVLWWSPDPRMVLYLEEFKVSRSFRRTIRTCMREASWSFLMDTHFADVMRACARTPRNGQTGTWITMDMRNAYGELHASGHAHSFEAWHYGQLVGGGYGISIGRMFYGESMFALETDASKLALAALVNCLQKLEFHVIDCQQNTRHLASLGGREIPRTEFARQVTHLAGLDAPLVWPGVLELPAI